MTTTVSSKDLNDLVDFLTEEVAVAELPEIPYDSAPDEGSYEVDEAEDAYMTALHNVIHDAIAYVVEHSGWQVTSGKDMRLAA